MARRSKTSSKTSKADARKASPVRGRKSAKTKNRIASAAKPRKPSLIADLEARLELRTQEAEEFRQQQSATADILKVIASSPADVGPVLKEIVESACELCDAYDAGVLLRIGDDLHYSAHHGPIPIGLDRWPINRRWVTGCCVIDRITLQVSDLQSSEGVDFPEGREHSRRMGHRCILAVPLLREGEAIGAITLRRLEPVAFEEKQIALLQTFADQAMIAIENVRLFNETKQALERQTATADVLQVISASPGDLVPVFDTMLENAVRICDASFGNIYRWDGESLHLAATRNTPPSYAEVRAKNPFRANDGTAVGRMIATKALVQEADITEGAAFKASNPQSIAALQIGAVRAFLAVPLLRDGELVGAFVLSRREARPFTEKQIALVTYFAAQAVIAIENARLLQELRQRTNDLTKSLDDLRNAQDRLVQTEKLASLGQLTAGIAHEIKNPLNFVNNFSALSAELVDEMTDVFENPALDEADRRKELDEIRDLLKGNLEKVVLHGKRADSIVKNMLLHSREGSGELRSADINSLVEESLNLAYHGARAEKSGFNITLERNFDASAGSAELYPQEITRALLNLISNGLYAANKRKNESDQAEFEPTLLAATKNLGNAVEICIRDNGTGIPPEVKEKMFNPFFTTKPTGEGTGLGLSMTHDIVVKQHGGRIDVQTEPGAFTEFIITLPRENGLPK